jgi:hypothetical protein
MFSAVDGGPRKGHTHSDIPYPVTLCEKGAADRTICIQTFLHERNILCLLNEGSAKLGR